MASKLTEMLAPGETVLFHAYWTWWEIVVRVLYAFVIVFLLILGAGILAVGEIWLEEAPVVLLWAAIWLPWRMLGAEALVTERRLLYRTGRRHALVVELAIENIEDIVHIVWPTGIRSHLWVKARGKAPVRIQFVPGLRQLWAAIAQRAGMSPLPPIELGVKLAYHGSFLFSLLTGLALVMATAMALFGLVDEIESAALAVSLAIVLLIPACVLGILGGFLLGWIVSAFVIRCFLTAAQAQQFACMGYDRYDKGFENWGAERSVRASLRLFSWLYGKPMELDEE